VSAPFGRRLTRVVSNDAVGAYRVVVAADPDGPPPRPGQFYMLAAEAGWGGGRDERPFLPRALSVLREGPDGLQFLLEDVGPGTARLCALQAGEALWLTGPLGNGFEPPADGRRAVLCGGGVGIAPLAIWQDALGSAATVLLGFRDAEHADGAALLYGSAVATDDGSVGHHGFVTEMLVAELDRDAHAVVYACGPPPMLEAVRELCLARAIPAQLALEAPMACGFGACYGCVVPAADGGYVRVCVDGPVLDAAALAGVA